MLHQNFFAEILALAEHNGETQKKIGRQSIGQRKREKTSEYLPLFVARAFFVGSLLRCVDLSADFNSGTPFPTAELMGI